MRKIELYETFRNEFEECWEDPLNCDLLQRVATEALNQRDTEILLVLADAEENIMDWKEKNITKERQGEKAIPDYIWDEMARELDDWANDICKAPSGVPHDAPETDEEKNMQKAIDAARQHHDQQAEGTLQKRIAWDKVCELMCQKEKMRMKPFETMITETPHIYSPAVIDIYLNGKEPTSPAQWHEALLKISNKMKDYAKNLRNAEP